MKYIKYIRISSLLPIWKVYSGGMKKKFQISALKTADTKTGKISHTIAMSDTVTSNISAAV
jgi:hypothetical protein